MSMIKGNEKDMMNAVDRILATVTGKPTDRIPIYPMIDALPAELFDISTQEYYSKTDNVLKGQDKLQELFELDYISNFYYLAIETELFGMNTMFFDRGSPNTGEPVAKNVDFFTEANMPDLSSSPIYKKTIDTTKGLVEKYKGKKPILSVQSAPFSLPAMLMGSSQWFETLLMYPDRVEEIIEFAIKFSETWARGHLDAGADVIAVVDGVGTATSIPKEVFQEFVIPIYQRLTNDLGAPIVFYTAGGDIEPFADIFDQTKTIGVFPSANDDLEQIKKHATGKYTLFGNINNLELADWPSDFMDEVVRETIKIGKTGGYYVFATQHMIPHGVSKERIAELINTALKYAYYD